MDRVEIEIDDLGDGDDDDVGDSADGGGGDDVNGAQEFDPGAVESWEQTSRPPVVLFQVPSSPRQCCQSCSASGESGPLICDA